ncbi:MAG: N-acetyltransferase, partial [Endomicrobiaceae bacterium]
MLARSLNDIYESIRSFFVYEDEQGFIRGCCSSEIFWEDVAEIRSLAVSKEVLGKGAGKDLVYSCMADVKSLGIKKVFALTYIDGFFTNMGFKIISRDSLPHKVWKVCINCPKFPDCDETAVEKEL